MRLVYLQTILLIYLTLHFVQGGNQHRSVLLSDVKTLTLHRGRQTEARRVSSIPQLKCVGGSGKCAHQPDVVQCYNRGSDGVDIQWECTAQMPDKYKFGSLSVSCEGYAYPDDPYILAGSCGLEYNLDLKEKNSQYSNQRQYESSSSSTLFSFLIKAAILVAIFYLLKSWLFNRNRQGGTSSMSTGPDHRPPGGGGGGGGFGWFSNFFNGGNGGYRGSPNYGDFRRRQPPPPGFRTDFTDDASCEGNRQQNTTGGGVPSFLTGAALGALGGYAFGNRNQRHDTTHQTHTGNTGNTGWFGGTGDASTHRRRTPSPQSSSTYTSTGFGGTTRR